MDIITITVHNDIDPSCRRLSLVKHFKLDLTVDPTDFIRECIKYTEDQHRALFPRNMNFTRPTTTVEIMPRNVLAIQEEERAEAMSGVLSS
jgi:hypothetical protein